MFMMLLGGFGSFKLERLSASLRLHYLDKARQGGKGSLTWLGSRQHVPPFRLVRLDRGQHFQSWMILSYCMRFGSVDVVETEGKIVEAKTNVQASYRFIPHLWYVWRIDVLERSSIRSVQVALAEDQQQKGDVLVLQSWTILIALSTEKVHTVYYIQYIGDIVLRAQTLQRN